MTRRILLVDDDESSRLTLSVLLEDEGFTVATASSCAAARTAIARGDLVDVVLLDEELGDGTGTELLPALRTAWPGARVVRLSGRASDELEGGGDGFFVKGESFDELVAVLR